MIACADAAGGVAALLPPDPLHPLVIHGQTFQPEPPVDQSPTPANMTPGQRQDASAQLLLVNRLHRCRPALTVAVLTRLPAGSALGHPESILKNTDGSETSLRAQKFHSENPTAAPGLRLEHRFVQLCLRKKALEADILLLQLLEAFGLGCFHPSQQLLPALI